MTYSYHLTCLLYFTYPGASAGGFKLSGGTCKQCSVINYKHASLIAKQFLASILIAFGMSQFHGEATEGPARDLVRQISFGGRGGRGGILHSPHPLRDGNTRRATNSW
ncbi:hypothetical protein NPIL_193231 [Nephila pilipes]|uniref:Uncharacterized protein n=1 Tax=Nephila pilipes TaxID=299642 RepID=A0A8X6IWP6_NEPPI|nr:hypothetical protein NPIL_193231 [Nephila pilipes]